MRRPSHATTPENRSDPAPAADSPPTDARNAIWRWISTLASSRPPQYLSSLAEITTFETVATEQGTTFRAVVLLHEKVETLDRFERREDHSTWGRHNRRLVEQLGGAAMLARLYDQLLLVIEARPSAAVVRSHPGAVEETYTALIRALH